MQGLLSVPVRHTLSLPVHRPRDSKLSEEGSESKVFSFGAIQEKETPCVTSYGSTCVKHLTIGLRDISSTALSTE